VLGILYESFIHPLTILSGLPSAGLGALLTLLIFGVDLSLYAFVGVIMLIGIVKKNAIMMIDFALDRQRRDGIAAAQAIFQACLIRFRPIMMTTMAALVGTLPIALGLGAGAEVRRPLGLAVGRRTPALAVPHAVPDAGGVPLPRPLLQRPGGDTGSSACPGPPDAVYRFSTGIGRPVRNPWINWKPISPADLRLDFLLYALGERHRTQVEDELYEIADDAALAFAGQMDVVHQAHVELDEMCRCVAEFAQPSLAGTEIVVGEADADVPGSAQRV
jgi:hypothetical protein